MMRLHPGIAISLVLVIVLSGGLSYLSPTATAGIPSAPHSVPVSPTKAVVAPAVIMPLSGPLPNYDNNLWNRLCADGIGAGSCPPNYQPPETYKAMGAYDATDGLGLYFGGQKSTLAAQSSQLWSWNGTGWNQTSPFVPAGGIPARSNGSFVWDTNDSVGLLFGGFNASRSTCLTDTWELIPLAVTGTNFQWINITSTAGAPPPGGCGGLMVNLPTTGNHSGYVLYTGGKSYGAHYYNATWEFFSGTWHNVTSTLPFPQPAQRTEGGIAYDPTHDLAVMTGGLGPGGLLNDSWKWGKAGGSYRWSLLYASGSTNTSAGPKAAMSFSMTYDSNTQVIYYTGGATGNLATSSSQVLKPYRDTWFISNGIWKNATAGLSTRTAAAGTNQPLPTFGAVFFNYPTGIYSLLQGGKYSSGVANWTYQLTLLLIPTLQVSNSEVAVGNSITFWGNATGSGASTAARMWSGLPTGCAAGNVTTFVCTPTGAGTFLVQLNVTGTAVGSGTTVKMTTILVDPSATLPSVVTASTSIAAQPNVTGFWAMAYSCSVSLQPLCAAFLNETPVHVYRVAGAMEGYNATSGVDYSRFGGTVAPNWNWTALIRLCQIVPKPCYLDGAIPTQNNDTGLTYADVQYVQHNYSYSPAFWSLGNEPQGWVHFEQPFSATPYPLPYTRITNAMYANPLGYVENRIAGAVLKAEPGAQIIAIQSSTCQNLFNFINTSALYTYQRNHIVIACHAYPGGVGPVDATPATFLSSTSVRQTAGFIVQSRIALNTACGRTCANLPIWVTELNGGQNGGSNAKWLASWPDADFYASQAAQFLSNNVTQIEPFLLGCGPAAAYTLLGPGCVATPASNVWTNVFDHLRMNSIYNLTFSGGPGGLFGIKGTNTSGSSYFIVNTNTSVSSLVTVPNAVAAWTSTTYQGSPLVPWTETNYTPGLTPIVWSLPPMGILLINANPTPNSASYNPNIPTPTLSVIDTSPTTVTLDWTLPPNAAPTNYTLVRYGTSCQDLNSQEVVYGAQTYVTVGYLSPLTPYCFVVSVFSAQGLSGFSNPVQTYTALINIPIFNLHTPQLSITSVSFLLGGIVIGGFGYSGYDRPKYRNLGATLLILGTLSVVGAVFLIVGLVPT